MSAKVGYQILHIPNRGMLGMWDNPDALISTRAKPAGMGHPV